MTAHANPYLHAIACSGCRRTIDPNAGDYLRCGEFWYHAACVPSCRACGRFVGPDDDACEAVWSVEAQVLSTPFGYAQHPHRFVCPDCLDSALADEAPYLD